MCDSSKEPHRLTDYKSEEKMKNIEILLKTLTIFIEKKEFFASHLVKF